MTRDKPIMGEIGGCQGGATKGYQDAGWYVIAIDIVDHSDRSPADEFIVIDPADSFTIISELAGVDAWHASWPCQKYTHGNAANDTSDLPDLLTPGRAALRATGLPYVIENVPRAPLVNPMTLCGTMFDLTTTDDDGTLLHLKRHRLFESNVLLVPPRPDIVHKRSMQWAGSYGGGRREKVAARKIRKGGYCPPVHILERLLGIDWMDEYGLFQALPPVYTEWIGTQLLDAIAQPDYSSVLGFGTGWGM